MSVTTQPTVITEITRPSPPAHFTSLDAWLDEGRELRKYGKGLTQQGEVLRRNSGVLQWDIGDWLLKGEVGVEKKALKPTAFKKRALEITGYRSWGSLKNLMTIARQVKESRRRDGRQGRKFLSYAIHVEAANFGDEKQEWLLEKADEGVPWSLHSDGTHPPFSVREFKKFIARMQELGELPKGATDKPRKKDSSGQQILKLQVSDTDYEYFSRLSLALDPKLPTGEPKPEAALRWCADGYVREHKAEIMEKIAAAQPWREKIHGHTKS
jgi:hypothetical protein